MVIDLLASGKPGTALESFVLSPAHINSVPCSPSDNHFHSQLTTSQSEATAAPVEGTRVHPQRQRFLAGASFFNYDACGSLRPGKPAIELFTYPYMGLAIHVALTGFAYEFFTYGFGRLLAEYLKAHDERQVNAASFILAWPQALSVVIGILSDAFPIYGYRRKSYMVLGWLLTLSMCVVIIILDLFGNSGDKLYASAARNELRVLESGRFAVAFLALSLLTAISIQICWLSAMALSIEFAQREQIYYRGRLQGTLVSLYYFGGFLARVVTVLIISEGATSEHVTSTVSMGQAAMLLAGVSVFAVPFAWQCVTEDCVPLRTDSGYESVPVRQRLARFWKYCHHNIAYRTLFFICLHSLFASLYNRNAQGAVKEWSQVTTKGLLAFDAVRLLVLTISALVFTHYLRNCSWRKVAFWGTVIALVDYAVLVLVTVYDVERSPWCFFALMLINNTPVAWMLVFVLILATEISEIGYEGVTVALGISYQTLAFTTSRIFSGIFPAVFGFDVTLDQVRDDDPSTRAAVASAYFLTFVLTLPALLTPLLMPQQKLDAQQMHAFGGYNQYASRALLVLFAVLLGFNLAASMVIIL